MEIILAKSAGFCFGVSRAVKMAYENAGENVYTYGPLAHNNDVINDLREKGIKIADSIEGLQADKLILRAHGVGPEVYKSLEERNIEFVDCTCPCVKVIHRKVQKCFNEGFDIIIIGDANHPEIKAINAYADNKSVIIGNMEQAQSAELSIDRKYCLVGQTTFNRNLFEEITDVLKEKLEHLIIYNTICDATRTRQEEALKIAGKVDHMIVLGDKKSSNTTKLYEICKKTCKNTYFIESISELELNIFNSFDKIGITAGASTPPAIIKEAIFRMSELDNNAMNTNQSFEQMLNESLVTLHTGDIVKGTVIQIVNGEVSVNLGYKSDGLIPRGEFSDNPDVNPSEVLKEGDEIEVFVVRVNDGDGNVLLSKKRLEMQKGYTELEEAFNNKTTVKGRVTEVVKGGLIATVKGVRVFIPSSQISGRFVDDLTQFVGKDYNFNVLEFDRQKRRIVAGRKELVQTEEKLKKEAVFNNIEVGQKVEGTVSRLVDFGAFVDLGGADGLIHISEMSWGRVKKASDVLKEGDKVTVSVLNVDKEKGKISLSLKDVIENPWNNISEKYPVGEIVEGKVVRHVPFGAFVELEPGVDGLVHISQIAQKHVVKAEDELKIGEIIKIKVMEVDAENKKISLSKKEVDGIKAEDAPVEETPAEEANPEA